MKSRLERMTLTEVIERLNRDASESGAADEVFDVVAFRRATSVPYGRLDPSIVSRPITTWPGDSKLVHADRDSTETLSEDAILYFHGGGMVAGGWSSHRAIFSELARASGMTLYYCDYSLAPEHPYPAALEEAFDCYRWLCEEEGTKNIHIVGDSAGGALVMALFGRVHESELANPKSLVAICPMLTFSPETSSFVANSLFGAAIADAYCGDYPKDHPEISPLYADYTDLPRILMQTGGVDQFKGEVMEFRQRLTSLQAPFYVSEWDEMPHVWHRFAPDFAPAKTAILEVAEFLKGENPNFGLQFSRGEYRRVSL